MPLSQQSQQSFNNYRRSMSASSAYLEKVVNESQISYSTGASILPPHYDMSTNKVFLIMNGVLACLTLSNILFKDLQVKGGINAFELTFA